ncbi:cytochrome P450 4C1-like [Arctopsyche grandis]|uniref:cytochrome P450 4C1-like n=1 Tax=Arctopsyche grandis TaxID=121162 RepID=UPI00406D76F8
MFFVLFCVLLVLYGLHSYIHNNDSARLFNKIPGPKILPIVGNSLDFVVTQVPLFYRMRALANKYKGIYRLWIINNSNVNLYNPYDIEMVLTSQKHITKNRIYYFIHPWLNDGLLTSTGDKWHSRRKILTPAFHFNILKQFTRTFVEQSDQLVEKLKKTESQGVDILPYITDFALHSICGKIISI